MSMPVLVHATARLCRCPPRQALDHLSLRPGMSRWILGMWDCTESSPGLFTGASLFDGGIGWVRVVVDGAAGNVEYLVGASPQALAPRIRARVTPGPLLGYDAGTCVVTLEAWRTQDMSDERWMRLAHTHEAEIELIRAQLESAPGGPA
jgi:hypothetical protein